jgi:two-component system sensor histidine kinase BaeS
VLPLLIGVVLAVTIGGWTSVAVAVVSWAGLAVVVGVGLRTALRSWYPVRSLIDTAGRLADGDYGARADPAGRGPVREVVDSFNRMAERLERTETERRRLLADVGHELRTPMTIIRGELEAMADGVRELDVPEVRRLLGDVDVMERLLDDLATLSTAEAGMLTVHREPTETIGLVRGVVDGLGGDAAAAGVTVEVTSTEPEIEADIDPIRVREIVANLVGNALRATPPAGQIVVSVERDEDDLVITVADTGRGIPATEIDRVFDRFHKGPGSGGSGLGLTISRNLAVAHGGGITLTSEEGMGTTVTTTIPLGTDGSPA